MACVFFAVAPACSVESGGPSRRRELFDAGPTVPPNSPGSPRTLSIDAESNLVALGFGEDTELTVLLSGTAGEPLIDRRVTFELIGRPEDSSLSSLFVETDAEGKARVTLRAATRPVMFEVRASSVSARTVSFSVSVSSNGFGSLVVNAPYKGIRVVDERFVIALPNLSCDAASYRTGDAKTVFAPDDASATLVALPAGVPYAIVAIAESASDKMVARACQEGVMVPEQGEDQLTLTFLDEPLAPSPRLDLEIELEAGSAAASLGATIRSAVNELVRASGGSAPRDIEGHFWLDALEASLRDGNAQEVALADALNAARTNPQGSSLEGELASLLEVNDEGAGEVATLIAAQVRESLDRITLQADVTIGRGEMPEIEVESLQISALDVNSAAPRVVLDEAKAVARGELVGEDMFELLELELSPGLGSLAADAIDELLKVDASDVTVDFEASAGCTSLREWYGKQMVIDPDPPECGEDCIKRACKRAFQQITDAAEDALHQVDDERPIATLQGTFVLYDSEGDLLAETMIAERIAGAWEPAPDAGLADTLRGKAEAEAP